MVEFIISPTIEKRSNAYGIRCPQVFHGEIYLLILAVGVLSTDGLIYGKKKGFLMNCFAHYLVMRTWIGSSLMAVLLGLINIVAVQELLTMNQLERAEVEIHLAVDSGGLPVYYELSCGNTHDIVHAESLVANCPTSNIVVADKGYYSEKQRAFVRDNNATPVIPRKGNSLVGNEDID